MRALMDPSQTVGLSPAEIERAFRALIWYARLAWLQLCYLTWFRMRRGILLLERAQDPEQIQALLPSRGRCVVIVTSERPFHTLLQRQPRVCKIHQAITPLSLEARAILKPPSVDLPVQLTDSGSLAR